MLGTVLTSSLANNDLLHFVLGTVMACSMNNNPYLIMETALALSLNNNDLYLMFGIVLASSRNSANIITEHPLICKLKTMFPLIMAFVKSASTYKQDVLEHNSHN